MNNELPPLECVSSAEASVPATAYVEAVNKQKQEENQQHHNNHQQQQQHSNHHHQQSTPTSLAFGEASNSAGGNARRAATTIRLCRYFLRGNCRHGARCKFSHNATEDGDINNFINTNSNRRGNRSSSTQTTTAASALFAPVNISTTTTTSSVTSTSRTSITDKNNKNYAKLIKWAEAPAFVPRNPRIISTLQDIEQEALNNVTQAQQQPADHHHHLLLATNYHHHHHYQQQQTTNTTESKTWAEVVSGAEPSLVEDDLSSCTKTAAAASMKSLCPYRGFCPYADKCVYTLHWELCKMCDKYCLHPNDTEQRRRHNKKCVQRHEEDMEISFAVARSRDKVCGICMEVILEMPRGMRRFGILPQCNHVFCLGCIRKWRQMPDFSHSVTRSCPQCRVTSSFICPSLYWVDTKEQKDQLIKDYRASLGRKDCKYFKMGKGKCPFGSRCFYRHAMPNGEKVESCGGGTTNRMRKATSQTQRSNNVRVLNLVDFCLWDFVEQRDMSCVDSLLQGNNFVSVVDYDTDSD